MSDSPLNGLKVVARASGVAAAYAARLLGTMGADVSLAEPPQGTPLRREPPFLPDGVSALFAYLAAGARSRVCDLDGEDGRTALGALLSEADIFIDDTPVGRREALGLDEAAIARHRDGCGGASASGASMGVRAMAGRADRPCP